MAAAALLIGFAMFFFAPVVPWLLFPMRRRAGAAAAAAWGAALLILSTVVWDGAFLAPVLLTAFSCCVRLVLEAIGTLEEPRARRRARHSESRGARVARHPLAGPSRRTPP
ncbi:hypothetical protein ACIPSH_36425 [Streptomyces iakyrus]|uniref:hypothetical protein n=1 Tax=Streptomyces iakyrus TaxID=68219 RepID=UPI0037F169B3